jgi:acetyl-CoA acetyltransferase
MTSGSRTMSKRISYHGRVAIASAGMTPLTRKSGKTVLALATEACREAIAASGIDRREIDGIASFSMYDDSVPAESVAAALGLPDMNYVMDFNNGGPSGSFMVMHAAMAVEAGLAKSVLVFRALNGRSGMRVGRVKSQSEAAALRRSVGIIAYPQILALAYRRQMVEAGATEHDLYAAVANARRNASRNPRALRRDPVTEEAYFAQPYVASPFRNADCTIEVDGACAVLVTSLERARDLKLPPATVASSAWGSHQFDLDMGSMLSYDMPSKNVGWHMQDRLYGGCDLTPADIDVASLYDCFTGVLLQNMEGLGVCGYGEAGDYLRRKLAGGRGAVVNPSGGLLAEGYLHGMNVLAEAVWQVQGVAGPTQVDNCKVALTSSGGLTTASALLLARDHTRSAS